MKKRFIVALDSSNRQQNDQLKEFIRGRGLGWWHWLANLWLLVDPKGTLTARDIRNELVQIFPGVNNLVIELRGDDDTWSGFGPSSEEKNMFNWIKKNW